MMCHLIEIHLRDSSDQRCLFESRVAMLAVNPKVPPPPPQTDPCLPNGWGVFKKQFMIPSRSATPPRFYHVRNLAEDVIQGVDMVYADAPIAEEVLFTISLVADARNGQICLEE